MNNTINGAKLLVNSLEQNGVKYIFGVPGDIENEFFKELKDSNITFLTTRHEQAGAFMADVYGRLTGQIGVCFSTLGPGATNMLTGIANAHQDRSPVLALSGQLPHNNHYPGSHQYIDLPALYKEVTKGSLMINRARDIDTDINTAIALALAEKQGPVHVTIPIDILKDNATGYRTFNNNPKITYHFKEQLSTLYDLITQNESIVAIVGNSVIRSNACNELAEFLNNYNIPCYTTFQGKTALPYNHTLNCGTLSRHSKKARDVLGKQELILNFGYDIIEGVEPDIWRGAKQVVHIDASTPEGISKYSPSLEVVGNIKEILRILNEEYTHIKKNNSDLEDMKLRVQAPLDVEKMYPFHPAYLMKELSSILGPEDLIVSDVGLHKQFVGLYYNSTNPNTVLFSNGLSSMGFGFPAALASKLVHPEKKVVAICGDGGFQMNIQELATSLEYKLPITCIIMNDSALGMVKQKQKETTGTTYAAEYTHHPDYAKIAQGYGANGFKINSITDLKPTLEQALTSKKTTIIDVPILQYSDIQTMR